MVVAEELGLTEDEMQILQYGATLHDIGKIGVRESVLNKPDKLDEGEFCEIMSHSEKGEAIIADVDFLQPTRKIIRNHQEYHDGTGYPDGLKGDEIPLNVAIVSIADFYDALTTDRPYRKAFSHLDAMRMVREESGRKLNPVVVKAFLRIFDEPEIN
jgi:HD-GYP domain-containing protein (c-di-GMP phosphodiesterase class II)